MWYQGTEVHANRGSHPGSAALFDGPHRLSQLIDPLSQGSRDLEVMSRLLESLVKPWIGKSTDEVRTLGGPKPPN
jgi:hypothetical protein